MSLLDSVMEKLLGKKYRCDKCGEEFRGNRASCPSCNHTVFSPAG